MSDERPRTSTRDHERLRAQLTQWLSHRLVSPTISDFVVPATNGMSSETILFDVDSHDVDSHDGEREARRTDRFVIRLPPDPTAEPVFPRYDMPRQFDAMRLVGARTDVAVPATIWLEPDPEPLGAPFFVMERVDGLVPPDVMPYSFGDNWFFDADAADRSRLQQASIEVLAKIHSIPADDADAAFLAIDAPGDTFLRRHVNDQWSYYEWVAGDSLRSPLIERGFAWLEEHWPADEGTGVVNWGDARIGNIIYRDFEPVAVLDWEMAGHGSREIDLSWMIFLHRFFQDLTEQYGMPGMPSFMRTAEVASAYEALTGYAPRDLHWYLCYAAVRHAIVMFRITRRQIHFGEAVMPDNPDHAFLHHQTVADMIAGTYWAKL